MITRAATVADGKRLLAQMTPSRARVFSVQGFFDHLDRSRFTWAGIEPDGAVVNVGGVIGTDYEGIGYAWQVIDPVAVARNKRGYLRQGRQLLVLAHQIYPHLSVLIEPDNEPAQRHARRMGWNAIAPTALPSGESAVVFGRIVR